MAILNDAFTIREKMIKACLLLTEKKLVQGTGGNISVRTEDGFLITPSGIDYNNLSLSDMVEISLKGEVVKGERTPSVEREMHRMIFEQRQDVNAIVHTHSIYATSVAATRQNMQPITDNQVVIFGGIIRVAEYAAIGSKELATNVVEALEDSYGALLANHGTICVANTLNDALFRAEMMEVFAKIFILAKSAGGGIPLTEAEILTVNTDVKKRYGQKTV